MNEETSSSICVAVSVIGLVGAIFIMASCVRNETSTAASKEKAFIEAGYVQSFEKGNATPIWIKAAQ